MSSCACPLQQAIRSRRADCQQLLAYGIGEGEMPVALQRGHKFGQKRHQAPRTNTVGGAPSDFERSLHSGAIVRCPWSANLGGGRQGRARQEQDSIFACVAGGGDKLIKNDRLVRMRGLLIAWCDLRE